MTRSTGPSSATDIFSSQSAFMRGFIDDLFAAALALSLGLASQSAFMRGFIDDR